MTGNVAQVFVTDEEWAATLRGVHAALRPGGRLVFETRDPGARGVAGVEPRATYERVDVAGAGWWPLVEVPTCELPLVTFRWPYVFASDGAVLTSDSTLRFRAARRSRPPWPRPGSPVEDVRDAPDRPGPRAGLRRPPMTAERVATLVATRSGVS